MLEIEIVESNIIDGGIEVFARAWQDGVQIGFGADGSVDIERFRFVNPPVLVDDPLGDIVVLTGDESLGVPLVERRLRENPEEAILQAIESTIESMKNKGDDKNIILNKRGNTTTTVYSGASDEYVYATGSTWSTARNSGGVGGSNTATILAAQASKESPTNYVIYRSPMPFDTSAIGSDTISSATLKFTPQTNDSGGADNQSICVDKVTTITPATGDYAISNWAGVDQVTRVAITTLSVDTEATLTLNATGISNINGSGTTNFGFRFSFDVDNSTPTGASTSSRTFPYASEQTGTTKDPHLVIEHSAAASTFTPKVMMF